MSEVPTEMHMILHAKSPLLSFDFNKNLKCQQVRVRPSKIMFEENPFSNSQVVTCVQRDKCMDTKAHFFCNFLL
jgi:hypothetical protein